jgi:hypothetical protein
MREDEKVIALPAAHGADAGEEAHHARKQRNLKAKKDGVLLVRRSGHVAYIAYSTPYALEYAPAMEGAPEQIQWRICESCVTVHGWNLFPLFEDLQTRQCDSLRESAHGSDTAALGVPCITTLTVRMWI